MDTLSGIRYKDDFLVFMDIDLLLVHRCKSLYLVGKQTKFIKKKQGWLEHICDDKYICHHSDQVGDYYPLPKYSVGSKTVIILHYAVGGRI